MKTKLGFKHYRWMAFLASGCVLLATMGFTAAPVLAATQIACGTTYVVQSGDTLGNIAAACGTSLSDLEQANTQITNFSLIYPGQVIIIPSTAVIPITGGTGSYTVQSGDTLGSIALNNGVSLAALEAANPQITDPALIYPGQVINLPSGAVIPVTGGVPVATPVAGTTSYTVVSGDTLSNIALNNGVSLAALEAANPQITRPGPDLRWSGDQSAIRLRHSQ